MLNKIIVQDAIISIYVFIVTIIIIIYINEAYLDFMGALILLRYNGVSYFVYTPIVLLFVQVYLKYIQGSMRGISLSVIFYNFIIMLAVCNSIFILVGLLLLRGRY